MDRYGSLFLYEKDFERFNSTDGYVAESEWCHVLGWETRIHRWRFCKSLLSREHAEPPQPVGSRALAAPNLL